MVELKGLEPSTSCMPCKRSSQLSYNPTTEPVPRHEGLGVDPTSDDILSKNPLVVEIKYNFVVTQPLFSALEDNVVSRDSRK